jgi:hypothetical protein
MMPSSRALRWEPAVSAWTAPARRPAGRSRPPHGGCHVLPGCRQRRAPWRKPDRSAHRHAYSFTMPPGALATATSPGADLPTAEPAVARREPPATVSSGRGAPTAGQVDVPPSEQAP